MKSKISNFTEGMLMDYWFLSFAFFLLLGLLKTG